MREVSIDRAKEIITEPASVPTRSGVNLLSEGRSQSVLKFTRLLMEAEIQTFAEIEQLKNSSHDLVHLSGVHKFRYNPPSMKCEELRTYWTMFYCNDALLKQVNGLRDYIINTCEASAYRAGKSRRSYGLFLGVSGYDNDETGHLRRPWRTVEWVAEHRPKRTSWEPVGEFYPYISKRNEEDHKLLLEVDALVPKSLPNWSRADICQDILVAVLTGEAKLENIRDDVPRYIAWFFKKEPSKYGPLSLDSPVKGDSYKGGNNVKTLGESIAAEFA